MASYWNPFGDAMGLFWLAFSGYARLELQRELFQHHFDDLVLFLVPLLCIFKVTFAENGHDYSRSFGFFRASFFFSIFSARACERSEPERDRCVVEAASQARPEDHFGGIIFSSFMVWYHLDHINALQHCQNNCAFCFLAFRFSSIIDGFRDPILNKNVVFVHLSLQVSFSGDFWV